MGPLGEGRFHELRVHGVSDTPPGALLGMRPVLVDPPSNRCGDHPPSADITISRRPTGGGDLRAYSWGSLTSGARRTAFYILLLPYVLANVAGWMMLPVQKEDEASLAEPPRARAMPIRVVTLLVRLTGMVVTLIFALSTYLLVTDLGAYQWLVRNRGWPTQWVGVGVLLTGAVVLILFGFTRVRLRPDAPDPWEDGADPVGYAWLHRDQRELWNRPGIIVRLRRLHLAAAWASIALVAGLARPWAEGGIWQAWDRVAVGGAVLALVVAVALLSTVTLGSGLSIPRWLSFLIRWVSWLVALVALLVSAVRIAGISPLVQRGFLPAIRGSAVWVSLALLLLVVLALVMGWVARIRDVPRRAAWNLPGLLLLAAATGSGLGAGLALQAARLLGEDRGCQRLAASDGGGCDIVVGPTFDWLAIALTAILAVVGAVLLACFFVRFRAVEKNTPQRAMVAVRAVLDRASWLLVLLAVLALLALAAGVLIALRNGRLPSAGSLPGPVALAITALLLVPGVVMALWFASRVTPVWLRVALVVGLAGLIAFAALAVQGGWKHTVLGLSLPPATFLELAQLVALLLPTTVVVTRFVYAGLEDRDVRRGVGVLWDVGTFWPRWFHPFAPPTYSDRAVTDLTTRLNRVLASPDHTLLLAPHSQGSIIGTAAILGMDETSAERVALLTYGSPWSRYYAEFFPAVFSSACLTTLVGRLRHGAPGTTRWRNLHRASDPIGGPIAATPPGVPPPLEGALKHVDSPALPDRCERVHSSYDLEPAYAEAVDELRRILGPPPASTG